MPSSFAPFFTVPLFIGGIPYIPFAVLFAYLIKRSSSMKGLVLLSLLVPIAFALWLAVILLVVGYVSQSPRVFADSLNVGFYGILFGYIYVLLAWAIWIGAKSAGLVHNEFAT